jgi:cystathionine beta-lyase/cystathionine gamma-synthase
MTEKTCEIETRLQHPRIVAAPGGEPVTSPIYQSSTYILPTPELGAEIAASWHPQRFYTRYGSPNVAHVEAIVADLEGAESAVAVGSGMAAIAAAILSTVRAGDHVVAQTAHYTAALTLLTEWLPRQGVEVTQVDQTDIVAFGRAIGPKTRLVYTETPTNPTMALTDLKAVSALAHERGAIVVTDNTFASSFNQLPLTLGVDLVVHSATKYLNGHSDVTAGVVAGPRKLIEPVWKYARVHGPVLHSMEAWLLGRGLKTYALRMRQHNQTGVLVAEALAKASGVSKVHYPGLASHPQHELARRQMLGGFGGMMSFEVAGPTAEERFKRA